MQTSEEDEQDQLDEQISKNKKKPSKGSQQKKSFEEAMLSEEEEEDGEDFLPSQIKEQLRGKLQGRKQKSGTWLKENDLDEPTDFLDRSAISSVICTFFPFSFFGLLISAYILKTLLLLFSKQEWRQ